MNKKINIMALEGIPLIKTGDNITQIIFNKLNEKEITLKNGDIILIAQTIISKSIGRIRDLNTINPSKKAIEIYNKLKPITMEYGLPIKEPELIQAILDESKEIIKTEHVMIVETKQGFICANAGIDKSNVEGKTKVSLLPEDSDREAKIIRDSIKKLTGKDVAVIITDSFGRPFRIGAVGVALGISGIQATLDKRGAKDLFGYKLKSTIVAQVDNLASAAQLIMGESNEGLPVVIIRGYNFELVEKSSTSTILRDKKRDMFRIPEIKDKFIEILTSRRSYKSKFKNEKIDINILKKCIDLARWAPSAHNGQFWRYIIISKGKVRDRLVAKMNEKLKIDLTKDNKSEIYIRNKIKKSKSQFLNAPYLILLCLETRDLPKYSDADRDQNEFIMGIQSISASATYLLLAFEYYNLASCWYCAPLFVKTLIKRLLKLPESYYPMAFFTVGYPEKKASIPKRKRLDKIIYNL